MKRNLVMLVNVWVGWGYWDDMNEQNILHCRRLLI
jgi:hypothetical protein